MGISKNHSDLYGGRSRAKPIIEAPLVWITIIMYLGLIVYYFIH